MNYYLIHKLDMGFSHCWWVQFLPALISLLKKMKFLKYYFYNPMKFQNTTFKTDQKRNRFSLFIEYSRMLLYAIKELKKKYITHLRNKCCIK